MKFSNLPVNWKNENQDFRIEEYVSRVVTESLQRGFRVLILSWDLGNLKTCVSLKKKTAAPPLNVLKLRTISVNLAPSSLNDVVALVLQVPSERRALVQRLFSELDDSDEHDN